MLPVVTGLCEQGIPVDFFAQAWARPEIERTGARFVDLYARRDMLTPDGTSLPMALRADGADLNIYSEPPEFLLPEERAPFEPLEFFGSYWPAGHAGPAAPDPFGPGAETGLKVYAGLGTAVRLECPEQAMMVLEIIADALATYPNARGLITLGGEQVTPADLERLRRPNVRVEPAVDPTAVLRHASAFVCHHGLNSTHEAIIHEVPMLSVPFFGDQPQLAARCQALGLAVPLGRAPGGAPRWPTSMPPSTGFGRRARPCARASPRRMAGRWR